MLAGRDPAPLTPYYRGFKVGRVVHCFVCDVSACVCLCAYSFLFSCVCEQSQAHVERVR